MKVFPLLLTAAALVSCDRSHDADAAGKPDRATARAEAAASLAAELRRLRDDCLTHFHAADQARTRLEAATDQPDPAKTPAQLAAQSHTLREAWEQQGREADIAAQALGYLSFGTSSRRARFNYARWFDKMMDARLRAGQSGSPTAATAEFNALIILDLPAILKDAEDLDEIDPPREFLGLRGRYLLAEMRVAEMTEKARSLPSVADPSLPAAVALPSDPEMHEADLSLGSFRMALDDENQANIYGKWLAAFRAADLAARDPLNEEALHAFHHLSLMDLPAILKEFK